MSTKPMLLIGGPLDGKTANLRDIWPLIQTVDIDGQVGEYRAIPDLDCAHAVGEPYGVVTRAQTVPADAPVDQVFQLANWLATDLVTNGRGVDLRTLKLRCGEPLFGTRQVRVQALGKR